MLIHSIIVIIIKLRDYKYVNIQFSYADEEKEKNNIQMTKEIYDRNIQQKMNMIW